MMNVEPTTVTKDENGYWTHPHLGVFAEHVKTSELQEWGKDRGIEIKTISMEDDSISDDLYEEVKLWKPECLWSGSFILSIHDTEDGPVAWLAKKLK